MKTRGKRFSFSGKVWLGRKVNKKYQFRLPSERNWTDAREYGITSFGWKLRDTVDSK